MFRIADKAEVEKTKQGASVSAPSKWGIGKIILWVIILGGLAYMIYFQFV